MVKLGTFREDLFYRLNVLPFTLPSLEERISDLPDLVLVLLEKIGKRIGKRNLAIQPEALELLKSYSFPGNIRELENLLERWAILEPSTQIPASSVQADLDASPLEPPILSQTSFQTSTDTEPYPRTLNLKEWEKEAIRRALELHQGNRTRAAAELSISRKTLIQKIGVYFPNGTL